MTASSFKSHHAPYIALLTVLALGVFAMAFTTTVRDTGEAGIRRTLPVTLRGWQGEEVRYCQNRTCQQLVLQKRFEQEETCPTCGGSLSTASIVEWSLLPADTYIHKKVYTFPGKPYILASIVLSGASRTSIHRPQICLVGDGREILATHVIEVPLQNRKPLKVTVLDMLQRNKLPDGTWGVQHSFYAYWFVSPDHETPYHGERMFWMAYDRVFRGLSHRWAYIATSSWRDPENDQHLVRASEFIHDLYLSIAEPNS